MEFVGALGRYVRVQRDFHLEVLEMVHKRGDWVWLREEMSRKFRQEAW